MKARDEIEAIAEWYRMSLQEAKETRERLERENPDEIQAITDWWLDICVDDK